ncbi:MAG TPA: M56 family metallopeptidase [Gammaproteobacteria bacterium]
MTAEAILTALVRMNFVAGVAIALVLALRPLVLRWLGARIAYWCWLVVPVTAAASFLPARRRRRRARSPTKRRSAAPKRRPHRPSGRWSKWFPGAGRSASTAGCSRPTATTSPGESSAAATEVSIEKVPYEFQRGGNQMMRIRTAP